MSRDRESDRKEDFEEILAELMQAIDTGESIDRDRWTAQHPEFAAQLADFFDKHSQMEQIARPLRAAAGELHIRCPHCHNPIELFEDAELTDIGCPSCGSSFSLVSDLGIPQNGTGGPQTVGHFQLMKQVGVGQFGSVWKARDTKLDRIVAVKFPRNRQLDAAQTELFLRDARAAAQLKHANIVGVHEVGKQGDRVFIVSDYIEGKTLKEWQKERKLSPHAVAELCEKIALALHHAHESGVIHRDLKPGNIMMSSDDEPHIVDFGLAKREAGEITMTLEGQILGTPAYMSPEQARGEGHRVGRGTDVYSLGVILFELLTGELPFRGDKQMLVLQILKVDPPSPKNLNHDVPRDLETICLKCLEKDPANRFATTQDVASELNLWQTGKPIRARPVSAAERSWRWCRRNPSVSALSAASVLLLMSVAGISSWAYFSEFNRRREVEQLVEDLDTASATLRSINNQKAALDAALDKIGAEKAILDQEKKSLVQNVEVLTKSSSELDQRLYDTLLHLARVERHAENVELADVHLENCPLRLRGQDWQALKHKIRPAMRSFEGQNCVAVSPDGSRLAVGSDQGVVNVWDLDSGVIVMSLTARKQFMPVVAVAYSPDGDKLAAASGTMVYVWELDQIDAGPRLLKEHPTTVTDVAFHPDGRTLASASYSYTRASRFQPSELEGAVVVWDLHTGATYRLPGIGLVTYDPQGGFLATGGYSRENQKVAAVGSGFQQEPKLHLWDLNRQPFDASAVLISFETRYDFNCSPVFSPNGEQLAFVHSNSEVRVWSFRDNRFVLRSRIPGVRSLAFSADGRRLACGAGSKDSLDSRSYRSGQVVVLNLAATGTKERILPWHDTGVTGLHFVGEQLIAADARSVKLWDVRPMVDPSAEITAANTTLNVGPHDYALWGGSNSRVNAPAGHGIPLDWNVGDLESLDTPPPIVKGDKATRNPDRDKAVKPPQSKNIKWTARLGSNAYGNPIVANGKIFVGTNNAFVYLDRYSPKGYAPRGRRVRPDLGVLLCFDESTGDFCWQQSNEKLRTGRVHDWPLQGVCSTPLVDGDRLWFVTNRGEVLCLDTEGFRDAEDDGVEQGVWAYPWREVELSPQELQREADVVWRFNMMDRLGVSPHNMSNCSVITADGKLFVCTSNGLDETHINLPRPDAPSFICMDRETAEVLWTSNLPGENILHAQWASPSYGVFDGQAQVIFPGGDGWVYSFDPAGDGKGGAKLLWKFDGNPKRSEWILGGRGTRNNIIAFPAIYDGLVYVTMGQDPEHGEGVGLLWCINPRKRGDISAELAVDAEGNLLPHRRIQAVDAEKGERAIPNPNSGVMWYYHRVDRNGDGEIEFEEEFHRSMGIPAIKDDILYIADFSGLFHCIHAKTGHVYWTHDQSAACWGSALVVDGKVYIADEDGEVSVFRHSADPRIAMKNYNEDSMEGEPINVIDMGRSIYMTPIVANNVLYIATTTHLFAIAEDAQALSNRLGGASDLKAGPIK